ncbi:MAG: SatD family protein [candidate division WOR-3 bacterium]
MEKDNIYAVITGDIVKSRNLGERREEVLNLIREGINSLFSLKKGSFGGFSDIFRGDSFQLLVLNPSLALEIVVFLKAYLIAKITNKKIELRVGIGIGKIESFNPTNIRESDGEAFRLSGEAIDNISKYRRFLIKSNNPELNRYFNFISSSIDAITSHWSPLQAEAILLWISGENQISIGEKLGISQPAIHQRLQLGGHFALKEAFELFEYLIRKHYNI